MDRMKVTFVNVGYGEAVLLECPDARFMDGMFVMLIDGGSADPSEYADRTTGRLPLAEYLAARGIRHIDLMVNTHIHEDHTCGMLPAARTLKPAVLWQILPPELCKSAMHPLDPALARTVSQEKFLQALNDCQMLVRLVEQGGGVVHAMSAGETGRLCEGLRFWVLAPGAAQIAALQKRCLDLFGEQNEDAFRHKLSAMDTRMNNCSLILLLDYQGTRILLPGDTNCHGYDGIDPTALEAHLFKVGHHGQRDGADQALLEAVRPQAVVCCASSDRRYDSAHPETLRLIKAHGAKVYFSDCPRLSGVEALPPHRALAFTVGENGSLDARYLA